MTYQQQSTLHKILAIVGLVALVVLVAWLAISLVRVMPGAFASLASLADSVYHPERQAPTTQPLQLSTPSSIVNIDESFVITWNTLTMPGTYAFSYTCNEDGVALNIGNADGTFSNLNCNEPHYLGDDSSVVITAESSKKRFVDITYQLTFTPDDTNQEVVTTSKRLTVVNPNISTSVTVDSTDDEPEVAVEPEVGTPATATSPSGQTTTESEIIYRLPESNPNGVVDLQIRHVGVGELQGNTFIPRGQIDTDMQGAFQFAVKNIGTKTASTWSYEATLPNGSTYDSGAQVALRPNEEAVITLGFTIFGDTGIKTIGAKVKATEDTRSNNDKYSWVMTIVK